MFYISWNVSKFSWRGKVLRLVSALGVAFLVFGPVSLATAAENVQYQKVISTLEYAGKKQFRNQIVTVFAVRKEPVSGTEVLYSFAPQDPESSSTPQPASTPFSFVIDRKTRHVSHVSEATGYLPYWARVNNESVKSLRKVTSDHIGRTWKQRVDLSSLDDSPFDELNFTLTAIQVRTNAFGEMMAVRALSEPCLVEIPKGAFRCKINSVYLFGPDVEDIYLSMSVFRAVTDIGDATETLHHEVATYKTDAAGNPVDLSDVGMDFERLVTKLGLKTSSLSITEEGPLPQWARSEGLRAAQVANICSAAVCEGASNPVASVSIPTARLLESQTEGARRGGAFILQRLMRSFGWNLPTAAMVGGAIVTPVIISGGNGGDRHMVVSPR